MDEESRYLETPAATRLFSVAEQVSDCQALVNEEQMFALGMDEGQKAEIA
jgi:hypothetical protein